MTKKELDTLLTAASMAPSGGNVQPWKVKAFPNKLEISLDKKRSTSFIDVEKTASLFSLGCFVENIEVAAEHLNMEYDTKLNFRNLNDTLVTIEFSGRKTKSQGSRKKLYKHIKNRTTNRQLYDGTILEKKIIQSLLNTIKPYRQKLKLSAISGQRDKQNLAKILGRADVIRMTNKEAYNQMIEEFRWSSKEVTETRDGLDLKTLEMPKNLARIFTLVHKHRQLLKVLPRNVFEEISKPIIEGSSHVFCLSSKKEFTSEILFNSGKLVEEIWLSATSLGLSFQPWTVATFFIFRTYKYKGRGFSKDENDLVREVNGGIHSVFGLKNEEIPIFILRISKAKKPTARSLKLHWREFTEFAQ